MIVDLSTLKPHEQEQIDRLADEMMSGDFDFSPEALTARDVAFGAKTSLMIRNQLVILLASGARKAQARGLNDHFLAGYLAASQIVAELFRLMGLQPNGEVEAKFTPSEEVPASDN